MSKHDEAVEEAFRASRRAAGYSDKNINAEITELRNKSEFDSSVHWCHVERCIRAEIAAFLRAVQPNTELTYAIRTADGDIAAAAAVFRRLANEVEGGDEAHVSAATGTSAPCGSCGQFCRQASN